MAGAPKWQNVLDDVSLTERELEVLQLKARRLTNAEIAEQLFLSITTVKWYVRQIYNKLGVSNRSELVSAASQLGLLKPPQEKPQKPPRTFPTPLTPFVGRKQELHDLTTLLTDPDVRLVTIMGAGGMGKTRLALQAAEMLNGRFTDGIFWSPFSTKDEPDFVFATTEEYIAITLADTLGIWLNHVKSPEEKLGKYLQQKELLIILDSFEHLLSGATLLSDLLANTTACKFLVTSRERLNMPGEVLFHLQGLASESAESDASKLFLQTAVNVSNESFITKTSQVAIQRICQRLEGMPLAIELAAEWARLLPITEIEQELEHGLNFLETNTTSIRAIIDRSWNLLTPKQQNTFASLSVFQHSFSREAAQQIAGGNLATLSALFDKSLIQRTQADRYTLHDLLHQYAAEKLRTSGQLQSIRHAHCAYFAALADSQMIPLYRGGHSKIIADLDNLRAAWKWAVQQHRLEDIRLMVFPLDWFTDIRAYYLEGEAMMKLAVDALTMPEPQGLQGIVYGRTLTAYGLKQQRVHGVDRAESTIRQGLKILRRLKAWEELAWSQILAVYIGALGHDIQEREQICQESLKIFEEIDHPYGLAFTLLELGMHYKALDRYSESLLCIERSLAVSRSLADQEGVANSQRHLGHLNLHIGQYSEARQNFQEEHALWLELGFTRLASEALLCLGETYLAEGSYQKAESTLEESLAQFEQVGDKGNAIFALHNLTESALRQNRPNAARRFLRDARLLIEQRHDSQEQAKWCLLSGYVYLQQGNLEASRLAFSHSLDYALQAQTGNLIEPVLGFASWYQQQTNTEKAARLLGFAQAQTQLPAMLVQTTIAPLHESLSEELDEVTLTTLLQEGEKLLQQSIVNELNVVCSTT